LAESTASIWPEIELPRHLRYWLFLPVYPSNAVGAEEDPALAGCASPSGELCAYVGGGMVRERVPTEDLREMVDFQKLVDQRSCKLVERIELKLAEDREEADFGDDVAPTQRAAEACLRLAQRLAPHIALAPRLKSGAFTDDDGGVSLVLQSLVTDRRVSCRVPPGGTDITVIRVDESMQADTIPITLDDPSAPRELAAWVTKRV